MENVIVIIVIAVGVIYLWVLSLFARTAVKAILEKDIKQAMIDISVFFTLLLLMFFLIEFITISY